MTVSALRRRRSVRSTLREAWRLRRVWWFTATARTKARFARTFLGSFWLGLSNLFSIAVLALVYGTVFKVQDFNTYVVYLGIGLVAWNSIAAAVGSAPSLFEHNHAHVHNTSLNPIFYTLEEWAFQVQTFIQSFLMVLLALSYFQHDLFLNLIIYGWFDKRLPTKVQSGSFVDGKRNGKWTFYEYGSKKIETLYINGKQDVFEDS